MYIFSHIYILTAKNEVSDETKGSRILIVKKGDTKDAL